MSTVSRAVTRLRPGRPPDEPGPTFDRRLVAPMVVGSVLNPVNSSIIAVSLVPIGMAFHAPPAQTAWLVSALYIATAIGQPVVGKLVDLYGPRRLYLLGTAAVGVAGVVGLLAPDLGTLVGARVLLGFGTCAGYPASMYLIRSEAGRTGEDSPAWVLTVLAVANQTVAVIGPTLGGLLIGIGGWRSTLAVNIPLSLACLWLGARRLPAHTPRRRQPSVDGVAAPGFDLVGMLLFATALISGLVFLMGPAIEHWWLALVAIVASAAFVTLAYRRPDPFIDVRVLAGNGPLVRTYARNVLTAVVSYGFLYGFTQWLEEGHGFSASQAGLLLLPLFGVAIAVSATTGRRAEIRAKLIVGALFQILGCGLVLLLTGDSAVWLVIVVVLIVGVPQGLNNLANQMAVYRQADPARMGSSAGLLRTSMYLGAVIASAANATFLAQHANSAGLHGLGAFLTGAGVLLLVLTLVDRALR